MHSDEFARLRGDVDLEVDGCLREAESGPIRGDVTVRRPESALPIAARQDVEDTFRIGVHGRGKGDPSRHEVLRVARHSDSF